MPSPVIKIEGLGKQYRIGGKPSGYLTLREQVSRLATVPFRYLLKSREGSGSKGDRRNGLTGPGDHSHTGRIWALKGISLEIQPGEVVGVIGRNGAGKSTLLKILSRITAPTTGRVEIRGRVGSLLEVGTGFHPELTGRENIYLNGSILGMSRREIDRKFDEILSFSGVESLIDTPVKRFSSGMYLRLAFSVAAHLEPEIFLIDEVLAVGDDQFQKKCMGKIGEVAGQGRTIIFVSHQMSAVKTLCTRALLIHRGELVRDGSPGEVVNEYLTGEASELRPEKVWDGQGLGNSEVRLVGLRVRDPSGRLSSWHRSSQPIQIELEFDLASLHSAFCIGFDLINREGLTVFRSLQNDRGEEDWPPLRAGRNRLLCTIPPGVLNGGRYFIAPKAGFHAISTVVDGDAEIGFEVERDHSRSPFWTVDCPAKFPGVIAPCLAWRSTGEPVEMGMDEGIVQSELEAQT